jgi:diguanylate cyclase (GGDEF)-like protein
MAADPSGALRAGERAPRLVLRFALVTAAGLTLAAAVILVVVQHAYTLQAERHAIERTQLTVQGVLAERLRPSDLAAPVKGTRRRQLDVLFAGKVLSSENLVGTLYSPSGRVTYSTAHPLIGARNRTRTDIQTALEGRIASRVTHGGAEHDRVLVTDIPVVTGTQVTGVVSIEQDYAPIASAAKRSSLLIAAVLEGLLVGLSLILIPVLARASRRIRDHVAELDHVATHDELTGLPNRIGFRRVFESNTAAPTTEGSVLLIDIDGFHEINETLGSHNGDRLLTQVGSRLEDTLGGTDQIARIGEDEFAVLLSTSSRTQIDRIGRSLQDTLAETALTVDGVRIAIDVNIGAATIIGTGADLDTALRCASVALTAAKDNNTKLEIYDASLDSTNTSKQKLVTELRHGLAAGELIVHYQPQADLTTRWIRGAEALIRWQHPRRGLLAASEFIQAAERTGLITYIGRFVLEESTRQWQHWNTRGIKLDLAVNLTAVDLLDPHLPDEIAALLERNSLPPEYLVLEITERTLLRDERRTSEMLDRLARIGVRLAIDDYGTGYSSLSYLHRLPIHQVKLDRSFTTNITTNAISATIVRSTIELAHKLGATVVAEGIETDEQWHRLADLGCDIAQGYLIGKPLAANELQRRLTEKPQLHVAA